MKIAFICKENACRSQMAEALAKKMFIKHDMGFVSAGTHPANEVDQRALDVLREENIIWSGKPKNISEIGQVDIVVIMGCEVVCPTIPGAKTIV